MPVLGEPYLVQEGDIRWWHVRVRLLTPRLWERRERTCQVRIVVEGLGRGYDAMMFSGEGNEMEPQPEVVLTPQRPRSIPVVIRSPQDFPLNPSPQRRWTPVPLEGWRAWVTGRAAMVDRRGYFDIPPGTHRLALSLWEDAERALEPIPQGVVTLDLF